LIPNPKWFLRIAYVGIVVLALLVAPGFLPHKGSGPPGGWTVLNAGAARDDTAGGHDTTATSGTANDGSASTGDAGANGEPATGAPGSAATNPSSTSRAAGPKPNSPTTTAPRDPRLVAVPAGIDSAGGRDVTTELTNFLRSVPDHRTIVFPAGARYRVDGTLLLHNRNDLVIEANGALFFSDNDGTLAPRPGSGKDDGLAGLRGHWPRHRAHWVLWGSSGIIVRNIVIRGAHPNAGAHGEAYVAGLEAQHGFEFARDTRNSVIENCRITDTYGDFVYIGPNVEGITVRNCHLERSGRQGITVADGNNVTLAHNFVSQTGRTAFDLEPYTTGGKVTNVRIHDNDVGPAHGYFVGSKGAGDVSNISIVGNRLKGEPLHISNRPPRELSPRRHDWYIANNRAENQFGSPRAAIHLIYTIGVTVTGNYVPLQDGRHPAQVGFECIQCSAVSESNNTFVYI
jgi:hypothetical protein